MTKPSTRARAAKPAASALLQSMMPNSPDVAPQAPAQGPAQSPDDTRAQAMLNALAQQRNATADMIVNMAGDIAMLQAQRDQAKGIANELTKLCAEACRLGLNFDRTHAARLQEILAQVAPPAANGGVAP